MSKDQSGRASATTREPSQRAAPGQTPTAASSRAEIDEFLSRVSALGPTADTGGRGRLLFALDATMSRQPTWDQACTLQADMFREAASVGGLDIQLVYYRGLAECRATPWIAEPQRLGALMSRIDCRGGHTQIAKILVHARRENDKARIGALVFVGDAMEEALDALCAGAGNSAFAMSRPSCFRRATTRSASRHFARSCGSPAGPTAASLQGLRTNSENFCAPRQPTPPVG
jgi:hypothetical protein